MGIRRKFPHLFDRGGRPKYIVGQAIATLGLMPAFSSFVLQKRVAKRQKSLRVVGRKAEAFEKAIFLRQQYVAEEDGIIKLHAPCKSIAIFKNRGTHLDVCFIVPGRRRD